jgi:hypothetical protein
VWMVVRRDEGVCCLQFMQADSRRRMCSGHERMSVFLPTRSSLHTPDLGPSRATRPTLKLAVCLHTTASRVLATHASVLCP